jgi:hypothetical protein
LGVRNPGEFPVEWLVPRRHCHARLAGKCKDPYTLTVH